MPETRRTENEGDCGFSVVVGGSGSFHATLVLCKREREYRGTHLKRIRKN